MQVHQIDRRQRIFSVAIAPGIPLVPIGKYEFYHLYERNLCPIYQVELPKQILMMHFGHCFRKVRSSVVPDP